MQILSPIKLNGKALNLEELQRSIDACYLVEVIAPIVGENLHVPMRDLSTSLISLLSHQNTAVQLAAARAISSISQSISIVPFFLEALERLLHNNSSNAERLGGLLAMREIIKKCGVGLVPYIPLIVVFLMKRMSDPIIEVRSLATSSFAKAVALMPLAYGMNSPLGLSERQKGILETEGMFLNQLLDNSKMDDYDLPFKLLTGSLRTYQQDGINWLAFLKRFGLHGILADDMGLGKTLQSTSIIAAATIERRKRYVEGSSDVDKPLPSLVVCPATLVSHWPHEIAKFVSPDVLRPLMIHGSLKEREALLQKIQGDKVVIISYETLRSNIEALKQIEWLYIILDEGHAIRNPESKISIAARSLKGNHRLILSGTPVQNSVLEVWSMFEFLMPGYLGTSKEFFRKFGKSVEKARKSSGKISAEEQASILSLQLLHRQIMPFVLRRTKDQVLKDLPPKIIQDILCDPSDVQKALFENFDGSVITQAMEASGSSSDVKGHVFQQLHFLRRLCSHPVLVLDEKNPVHLQIAKGISSSWVDAISQICADLKYSPKLNALRELLIECGIGSEEGQFRETCKWLLCPSHVSDVCNYFYR